LTCLGIRRLLPNVLAFPLPRLGSLSDGYIGSLSVNFFADPYAVDEVLISPTTRLPLTRVLLVPLDITSSHLLPFAGYTARIDPAFVADQPSVPTAKTPITHFTSAIFRRARNVMRAYGQDAMILHDIVAVWAAIAHPPGLEGFAPGWTARRRVFLMERIGERTRGMCVVDRRENRGAHATGANRARVQAELERRIAAGSAETGGFGPLESVVVPARVEVEGELPRPREDEQEGVPVIESTPGPEALLQVMMKRIWHVEVDKESLTADLLLV